MAPSPLNTSRSPRVSAAAVIVSLIAACGGAGSFGVTLREVAVLKAGQDTIQRDVRDIKEDMGPRLRVVEDRTVRMETRLDDEARPRTRSTQ